MTFIKKRIAKLLNANRYLELKFVVLLFLLRYGFLKNAFSESMEKIGAGWQEKGSESKPIVFFFGVPSKDRKAIADALQQYRCAFAFPRTPWLRQCGFIAQHSPQAVWVLSPTTDKKNISLPVQKFLKKTETPFFFRIDNRYSD
jgi:hypothetical protein